MQSPLAATDEEPVFKATLSPHRSLGPAGLAVVVAITAGAAVFHLVVFVLAGAWPVAGFFGLDIVLLYGALWLSYRSGRAREFVFVSRSLLAIRKVNPAGKATEFRFNPFWTRFVVDRHKEIGITGMRIASRNTGTDVGSFLNPDDKESFADALSGALARVKRG